VDYALQRRAILADVWSGRVGTAEVCDATPYLQRAARYYGQATQVRCPVCRRDPLWHVHYVYGDELKTVSGQAKLPAELPRMAMDYRSFRVYVVEVCRSCGWNHLTESFLLGRDGLTGPADAPVDVPDRGAAKNSAKGAR